MKIVLACMQYNYGDINRGVSFEYQHFYQLLKRMGHDVILFDFLAEYNSSGKQLMNKKLYDLICNEQPDLAFFVLYTEEFDAEIIEKIGLLTKTFCFFSDDVWRKDYSRYWASKFNYFTTADFNGEYKYKKLGINTPVYFPFGCDTYLFKKYDMPKIYDVSFVGAWHPYREYIINKIAKKGYKVKARGYGWPDGSVSTEEMVKIFNQSKINLNLSNCSSSNIQYLLSSPRAIVNLIRSPKNIEQIKGRHFEINSCGGFQLSYYIDGLEKLYNIGSEIAVYIDEYDLLRKVEFYLDNEDLINKIADAGYRRSIKDHKYEARFNKLFEKMGLLVA